MEGEYQFELWPLSDEERSALDSGLSLAARLANAESPLSVVQVQALYEVIDEEEQDYKEGRIAVGLAFGELIAEKAGYEWVRVKDSYGEETSLSPPGLQIVCHPISMLEKRMDRGEAVNIAELRDETIKVVEERIASGDYKYR